MQINEFISVTAAGVSCTRCGRLGAGRCSHAQNVNIEQAQALLARPPQRHVEPRWEVIGQVESQHLNGRYDLLRLVDGTMACSCLSFIQSAGVRELVFPGGIRGSGCKHLRRHVGESDRQVRTQPPGPSDWQKYLLRSLCAECPEFLTAEQAYYAVRRGLELQGVQYAALVRHMRRQDRIRLLPVWAFGVEIEGYNVERRALASAIVGAGLPVFDGGRTTSPNGSWKLTGDASIHGIHPFELVSPKLIGQPGFNQLTRICETTRRAGGTGNRSCGLHVHVDAFNLGIDEIKNLARLWHKIERPILHRLVSTSRRTNSYCRPLDGATYSHILESTQLSQMSLVDRYHSLNVAAYARHRSLEIRLHQHSLNARKIRAWVTLQLLLASAVKQGLNPRQVHPTWDALGEALDVASGTPLVRQCWSYLTGRLGASDEEQQAAEERPAAREAA